MSDVIEQLEKVRSQTLELGKTLSDFPKEFWDIVEIMTGAWGRHVMKHMETQRGREKLGRWMMYLSEAMNTEHEIEPASPSFYYFLPAKESGFLPEGYEVIEDEEESFTLFHPYDNSTNLDFFKPMQTNMEHIGKEALFQYCQAEKIKGGLGLATVLAYNPQFIPEGIGAKPRAGGSWLCFPRTKVKDPEGYILIPCISLPRNEHSNSRHPLSIHFLHLGSQFGGPPERLKNGDYWESCFCSETWLIRELQK